MRESQIQEAACTTPILEEVDVCVLGGSCTGVFAAIRAARLGARVAIVEKLNCFGGSATAGMVCCWHSLKDVNFDKQIIGGLTQETLERLQRRNGLFIKEPGDQKARIHQIGIHMFNVEELKIELDEMITEAGIHPYLHTMFVKPYVENNELQGIIVENKSGRGVILAKAFVDATGDGDLCVRLGAEYHEAEQKQPASTCAIVHGFSEIPHANHLLYEHGEEFGIHNIGWDAEVANLPSATLWAKTNIYMDLAKAEELTAAEIEGRRQVRAMMDILRKYGENGEQLVLLNLAGTVAARETRQICCQYTLTGDDVLYGTRFEDAIANSSYPSDVHHTDKAGASYRYLDGLEEREIYGKYVEKIRWLPEGTSYHPYWQVPFRCMLPQLPQDYNVVVCGRAIDADKQGFAAARIMVTLNQTGEAAGVAAAISAITGKPIAELDAVKIRTKLKEGGSIII